MKKTILSMVAILGLLSGSAQGVNYEKTGLVATTGITAAIENKEVPGDYYVCSQTPGLKTIITYHSPSQSIDTLGVAPFLVNDAAYSVSGDVLWFAGRSSTNDTIMVGVSKIGNQLVYPNTFPQGTIKTLAATQNGLLVGGEFTVTGNNSVIYNNLALLTSGTWNTPNTAFPTGVSWIVSTMQRLSTGSLVIGCNPLETDSFVTCLIVDANVVDTIVFPIKPSVYTGVWEVSTISETPTLLHIGVSVVDTGTRALLVTAPLSDLYNANVDYVFAESAINNLTYHKNQLWFSLAGSTNAPNQYMISSVDPSAGLLPRYLNGVGTGFQRVLSMMETSSGKLLATGLFSYEVSNGDTAKQSMFITVTDTTPPLIVFTEGTDTVYYPVGTPMEFFDIWDTEGQIAVDNLDGTITDSIRAEGTIDNGTVGCYTVMYTVTDQAGLSDTAYRVFCVTDTVTSINNMLLIQSLFPNPAKDRVSVIIEEPADFAMYSLTGAELVVGKLVPGLNTIELGNAVTGIYLVRITTTDGRSATKKLHIE